MLHVVTMTALRPLAYKKDSAVAGSGRLPGRGMLRSLAWILIVLLPIQSIATTADSVWRPAHYHRHASQTAPVVADGDHAMHADDVIGYLDHQTDVDDARRHGASGRHHHVAGDIDVVYVADDEGDPTAPASTGKHGLDGTWNVPASRALLLAARVDAVAFAEVGTAYRSHRSSPPRPPPR